MCLYALVRNLVAVRRSDLEVTEIMPSDLSEQQPLLGPSNVLRTDRRKRRFPSFATSAVIFTGVMFLAAASVLIAQKSGFFWLNEDPVIQSTYSGQSTALSTGNGIEEQFDEAWRKGNELVKEREKLEKLLRDEGVTPDEGSPSATMQHLLKATVPKTVTDCALIVEYIKKSLGQCVSQDKLPAYCQTPQDENECNGRYYYRTFDGSCNNLRSSRWGKAHTAFDRLLRPAYADGISSPRESVLGGSLPNPRQISNAFYTHQTLPDPNFTMMAMNFGLFLDHDIIQIAPTTGLDGSYILCCNRRSQNESRLRHPECLEIEVPSSDPFYGPLQVTCLDFVRSRTVPGKCAGEREQLNLASAYIDGSAIYGSSREQNRYLRAFQKGLLKSRYVNGTTLLPVNRNQKCPFPKGHIPCLAAGDNRVNENVELASVHNLWFREHNRVAGRLSSKYPDWKDDRLFEEARRIVAAELQHIVYNEFLPLLLGRDAIHKYNLNVGKTKKFKDYREKEEGSIYNVFGAAAFRFGHSLIQGLLHLYDRDYRLKDVVPLHETFLNPQLLYQNAYDPLLRGMLRQRTNSVNNFISPEVRNRLFQPPGADYGLDLSAIGIQRGRDHGIPGYTAWREVCDLSPVETWKDLEHVMRNESVQKLKELYKSVHDIDLQPAALAENHLEGAMLGPTYVCLIGKQFHRLRVADRFWFEIRNEKWSFSKGQLKEIYNSNMARIICDNSDGIQRIQRNAFQIPSLTNPVVDCSELPVVDMTKW